MENRGSYVRSGMSNVLSLLTIAAALALGSNHVYAKTVGPAKVKAAGTSVTQSGNPAAGSVARRPAGCGHKTYGACAFPPHQGATSGNYPAVPTGDRATPPFTQNRIHCLVIGLSSQTA
jgi:hypothetical protein